jgi:hypothetical protein
MQMKKPQGGFGGGNPMNKPGSFQYPAAHPMKEVQPIDQVETDFDDDDDDDDIGAPQDWLKPKIFKGGGLV